LREEGIYREFFEAGDNRHDARSYFDGDAVVDSSGDLPYGGDCVIMQVKGPRAQHDYLSGLAPGCGHGKSCEGIPGLGCSQAVRSAQANGICTT